MKAHHRVTVLIAATLFIAASSPSWTTDSEPENRRSDNYDILGGFTDVYATDKQTKPCDGTPYDARTRGAQSASTIISGGRDDYLMHFNGHGVMQNEAYIGAVLCQNNSKVFGARCSSQSCVCHDAGNKVVADADWGKCLIVIWQACRSAVDTASHGNVAEAASGDGANASLGFTTDILRSEGYPEYGVQRYWAMYLWQALTQGSDLEQQGVPDCHPLPLSSAASFADFRVAGLYSGNHKGYDSYTIFGDEQQQAEPY